MARVTHEAGRRGKYMSLFLLENKSTVMKRRRPSFRSLHVRMLVAFAIVGIATSAWSAERATARAETYKPVSGQAGKDVIWIPTPQSLVDRMLDMAKVTN